ncbi:uncharacterized protein LOC131950963 [Physella acuta]|uniref:uncharacterized protein LOC131950963 n=1 Tax=Physella acuta TaxID=109671 RepID=UPI0027DD2820|nr:uncharacterized protein LOC131950963 [Physella acuta]
MFFLGILLTVATQVVSSNGQSVAQQCLTEQIRNNNLNPPIPNQNGGNPEAITMAAFDSICRNYNSYLNCFESRLPGSNQPADRFLQLVFTRRNMHTAYEGLCTLDLEHLRRNIRCLLSTPEVRRCYALFNQGVNQVVALENQNNQQLPRGALQDLACNVSVARYRCETAVYSFCNRQVGQIMQDFFYAGVTNDCRHQTGVRSRYTALFNGGPVATASLVMTVLMILMIAMLQLI